MHTFQHFYVIKKTTFHINQHNNCMKLMPYFLTQKKIKVFMFNVQ